MYHFLMNFQWSRYGRWLRKTNNSCCTSRPSCPKEEYRTENISSIFWTRSSHSMWLRSLVTPMSRETPCQTKPKPEKPSKFQTNGGTPSTQCRSFHVSVSVFLWLPWYLFSKLIFFSPVCRAKGKNHPLAEVKLQACAARKEETQDWTQRHLPAVHANAGGAKVRGAWGASSSC